MSTVVRIIRRYGAMHQMSMVVRVYRVLLPVSADHTNTGGPHRRRAWAVEARGVRRSGSPFPERMAHERV